MLEQEPRVHEVRVRGQFFGTDVEAAHQKSRRRKRFEKSELEIDCQHRTTCTDTLREPSRDRPTARSDVEATPSGRDPDFLETSDRIRVVIMLQQRQTMPFGFG